MNGLLAGGWGPPVVAGLIALTIAVAGGIATRTDDWYRRLRVPGWKPPDWAFGPVWAVIFALTTASAIIAWNADPEPAARLRLVAVFAVNGVLNIAWSVIFFRLRRPDWAFAEVLLFWLSILAVVLAVGQVSVPAALLNLPYLAWVSVAAGLNLTIVRLNPPFEPRFGNP
ncbi:MAG TPA: TspO/MBR family protein [Methylobacterium sp.]|uniref:TspO/MBR family protein n=1 Tax=Methylorubrum sp. B1-46 TaxID=2897334 RepID=UPI001E6220AF|nr:TspO/MBR family protein [Methylorubrum sp. B1-46]UGB25992.1 tryptophan-rich sensory protein [Methylorubrum sp. B1-46]HEV2543089.1 TspO/MBR family protein [Methylobacterium sp.]